MISSPPLSRPRNPSVQSCESEFTRSHPPYLSKAAIISTVFSIILLSLSMLGVFNTSILQHALNINSHTQIIEGIEIGLVSCSAALILRNGYKGWKAYKNKRDFYTGPSTTQKIYNKHEEYLRTETTLSPGSYWGKARIKTTSNRLIA